MGQSCTDIACHMLWWVKKTKTPISYYAATDKQFRSGTKLQRGQKIETADTDYSLNNLGISSKVRPMSPTDEMEQLNKAVMLSTKLNFPVSKALEDIGYDNVGLMYDLWAREFLRNAELQARAAAMLAEAQTSAQLAAQQNAQQNTQNAQPPEGGAPGMMGAEEGMSQAAFGAMGGSEGTNPAFGGMSPAQGAPSMTREAITGMDRMSQQ